MDEKMTTKDAYLVEAMRLFAEKGYDAVGVVEIAKAVGCTTSALYKHFKNKQVLFDEILERSKVGFHENMARLKANFDVMDQKEFVPLSVEEQVERVKGIFSAIAFGEEPKIFRRLVEKERFSHPELGRIYNEHYIHGQIKAFSKLMQTWIDNGVLKKNDPESLAVEYVSPVIVMISLCDNDPTMAPVAYSIIENHVKEFYQKNKV